MEQILYSIKLFIDKYLDQQIQEGGKLRYSKIGKPKILPMPSKNPSASLSKYGYKLNKSENDRKLALSKAIKDMG